MSVTATLWGAVQMTVVALVGIGLVTYGLSVQRDRRDELRGDARDRVRGELFDRLGREEPGWESWVGRLSRRERRELRELLDGLLRDLHGRERARLVDLGLALGIDERARANLGSERIHDRLRALAWLALLEEPVDEERLFETCADDPRTRAAAARLLYVCDRPRAGELGTSLLIWEGSRPLSVFGLDTLYVLNRAGSTPLLYRGSTAAGDWDPALLVQVCTVLRHCPSTDAPTEAFDWLRALLAHESPTVREAAIGAFAGRGWRPALRERIDAEALVADPDPSVREAAYGLLAAWGDRPAVELLERAVRGEEDDRCRLAAVRALYGNGIDAGDGRTWAWVRAEGAVG